MDLFVALSVLWLLLCLIVVLNKGAAGLILALAVPVPVFRLTPAEWLAPIALLVEIVKYRKVPIRGKSSAGVAPFVVVALGLFVLGGLWSPFKDRWLQSIAVLGLAVAQASAIFLFSRRAPSRVVWRLWIVLFAAVSGTALVWLALGKPEAWLQLRSTSGVVDFRLYDDLRLGHPWLGPSSYFASFAILSALVSLVAPVRLPMRIAGLSVGLGALLATTSRGALLAVAFGFAAYVVLLRGRDILLRLTIVILTIALSLWVFLQVARLRSDQLQGFLDSNGRSELYRNAWSTYFAQRPILGWGLDSWRLLPGLEGGTHSYSLTVLVEGGLLLFLAMAALLGAVVLVFVRGWSSPAGRGGLVILAALLINISLEASAEGVYFREMALGLLASLVAMSLKEQTHARTDPETNRTDSLTRGAVGAGPVISNI